MTERPLCLWAFSFFTGVLAGAGAGLPMVAALLSCVLLLGLFLWKQGFRRPFLVLFLFLFFFGYVLSREKWSFVREDLPEDQATLRMWGRVMEREEREKGSTIYLLVERWEEEGRSGISSENVGRRRLFRTRCVVYASGFESVEPGDRVALRGRVMHFAEPTNEGEFNQRNQFWGSDWHFAVYPEDFSVVEYKRGMAAALRALRVRLGETLDQITDEEGAGVFRAMVLGEKKAVPKELKELFMEGSIGHVLVVSGLHFSVLGMGLFSLIRPRSNFIIAGAAASVFLFVMGGVCGFSVSVVRAYVMFLIYVLAQVLGRDYDLPSALSLAGMLLLFQNPLVLFLPAFQLSVSAVLGIVLLVPLFGTVKKGKGWGRLLSGGLASLGIQLFTLPVTLYYFFSFNPYSFLLNGMVLPAMPTVLLSGLLGALVGTAIPAVGSWLVLPGRWLIRGVEVLCRLLGKMPFSSICVGRPAPVIMAVYYGLLLAAALVVRRHIPNLTWDGRKRRERREGRERGESGEGKIWLLCLFLPALVFFLRREPPARLDVLDVGQGQCVCVSLRGGETILYDGGSGDRSNVGSYVIAPFLKSRGITHVDHVFVSHLDQDHWSGIQELLEQGDVTIGTLYLSRASPRDEADQAACRLAEQHGVPVRRFGRGDMLAGKELSLEGLHPWEGMEVADRNETSLVLRLQVEGISVLLCGDVGQWSEEQMEQAGLLSPVDVLLVAHHGSKYSSGAPFLEALRPALGIISCGRNNSYGHPHSQTLERLAAAGCQVRCTMEEGAVSMSVEKRKVFFAFSFR